jgi:hypothetical protein
VKTAPPFLLVGNPGIFEIYGMNNLLSILKGIFKAFLPTPVAVIQHKVIKLWFLCRAF